MNHPYFIMSQFEDVTSLYVAKAEYYEKKYHELEKAVKGIISAHKISHVDWDGMRTAEKIINGD